MWSKSEYLHRMGKIFSYYVSDGTVKIKIQATSQPQSIIHTSDLNKLFPDVDLSSTGWRWDCFALLSPEGNLGSLQRLVCCVLSFLRIWSHLLEKSLWKTSFLCSVRYILDLLYYCSLYLSNIWCIHNLVCVIMIQRFHFFFVSNMDPQFPNR